MCELFVNADQKLWVTSHKSVRIQGMVTSIRLENHFWIVLEEIATRDSLTLPEMLNRLYAECVEANHDVGNFSSFLRVCAMRYAALQITGDIPFDKEVSIASLDSGSILIREEARFRNFALKTP